jgi:hypothetical protein
MMEGRAGRPPLDPFVVILSGERRSRTQSKDPAIEGGATTADIFF